MEKPNVLVIYRFLPQYRVEFYEQLREELHSNGIVLNLVYGKHKDSNALKRDEVDLPWAHYVPNRTVGVGRYELIWQPCWRWIRTHDLIVVEQANRLLLNYLLMFRRRVLPTKLALWGHGLNLQAEPDSLRNRLKRLYIKQCDWWFAYTESVKEIIVKAGYPESRITVVQNAIDTHGLAEAYAELTKAEVEAARQQLGLRDGFTGLFCGGMYREKRLDFLVQVCDKIKQRVPEFQMLFLGAGPEAEKVQEAARRRDWVHYVGPKFGKERLVFFKLADVLLMPGLVGLVILDSFATQTPMITTNFPYHSPEIEYLQSGDNGLMV
ncbi:glycosyltransferase, partial [Candidatus Parcubacteria bacterium]